MVHKPVFHRFDLRDTRRDWCLEHKHHHAHLTTYAQPAPIVTGEAEPAELTDANPHGGDA